MLRIAVVNDKKNILPCSFDAWASIYEYEDGEMKNTEVHRPVRGLIEMQRYSHVSIYPPDEEDVRAMHRRIDELVCGGIEDYVRVALERMGISVMRNVYGSMDTFAKDYLDRNAGETGRKLLERYSKAVTWEEMSSWDLQDLISRYDWEDGPGVPHLVAVHPLCTKELIRKMFILGEKSLDRVRYGDIASIRLWRCFLSELCHIHKSMT